MSLIIIDGAARHTGDTLGVVGPSDAAADYQRHPIPGQLELFAHSIDEQFIGYWSGWPVLADRDES